MKFLILFLDLDYLDFFNVSKEFCFKFFNKWSGYGILILFFIMYINLYMYMYELYIYI